MAGGWIGRFALGTRLVYGALQLGVRLARTATEILGSLARTSASFEASAVREILARERATKAATAEILGGARDRVPEDAAFAEAITRQRRTYNWRIRIGWIDPSTGERRERYLSISTDERLSPEEALRRGEELAGEEYGITSELVFESEITQATRARPEQRL